MRCLSCNKILTEEEINLTYDDGFYVDMCESCIELSEIPSFSPPEDYYDD